MATTSITLMKQKMLFNLPIPLPCGASNFSVKAGIVAVASVWVKIHSRACWCTCRRNWTDAEYVANIHVDKATFLFLVERLTPCLVKKIQD